MGKSQEFPITIKAGATPIKIYFSPLHGTTPSGSTRFAKRKTVSYDSFILSYYRGGTRHRQRFSSLELAKTEASRIRALLLNQDMVALQLTGKDLVTYSQASHIASELGLSLDALANEFVAARRILGDISLLEAAQFYDRYGKTIKERKSVPEVVEELLAGLKADNKSEYHVRDMERRLRTFAKEFAGPITEVDTKAIAEWLRNIKGTDQQGRDIIFAPKTRNHYRNAVVQLFNHARDHGYLPKGMPTEVEGVKPLEV